MSKGQRLPEVCPRDGGRASWEATRERWGSRSAGWWDVMPFVAGGQHPESKGGKTTPFS